MSTLGTKLVTKSFQAARAFGNLEHSELARTSTRQRWSGQNQEDSIDLVFLK